MVKFKAGDTAVANQTSKVNAITKGEEYPVFSVDGGYIITCNDRGNASFILSSRFDPVKQVEVDDPLPPAPESGLYFSYNNWRVATLKLGPGVVAIGVTGADLQVCLTPETALVMAHDLRRMAMELKRKQKREAE